MTVALAFGPMPRPDGAAYRCCVESGRPCDRPPAVALAADNYFRDPDLRQEFDLSGRIVCTFHQMHIAAYVADRNATDPDYTLDSVTE